MMATDELVDALNRGIVRAIQTSGRSLPSSAIPPENASPFRCEWTEYSTDLCCPAVEDLRRHFPPLEGDEVGSDGRPLLYAACLGLLLSGRRDDDGKGTDGTPLSTFLSIASYLLDELGVDPNRPTLTPGACHRPPLHLLARSCRPGAVRALVSRGANVNLADREGWTALMACCMPDVQSPEEGGPGAEERTETMRILLRAAPDVDARNYCGYTALHYACEGLNPRLVRCLLEEGGADGTLRTVWGQSCVGIVRSRNRKSPEDASTCETILASHLEGTGRMESIRTFLEEERKAIRLMDLVDDVLIPASRRPIPDDGGGGGLDAQDERIVTALMTHLDLDPKSLYQSEVFRRHPLEDANLYEDIHQRVMTLMPLAFRKVYRSSPTSEEREVVTCANYGMRKMAQTATEGVRRIDRSIIMRQSFRVHRERGHVAHQLEVLNDLIVGPLQRSLGFGIPSNAVLKEIIARAPRIVEMGAGMGYWSYLLSRMGADVVAYDVRPTEKSYLEDPKGKTANEYFASRSYFPVREGDASTVFGDLDPDISNRALLMVWPNNPDAEDNKHVAAEGPKLPEIWDLECLERYHQSGGGTVIYAGERETKIDLMKGATDADCGFCSSRKFQIFLQEHYELVAEFECPRWWMKEDDVTVWKRK